MKQNNIKKIVLKNMFLDKQVDEYYRKFSKQHPKFMKEHPLSAVSYIARLNIAQHQQKGLGSVNEPDKAVAYLKKSNARMKYYTDPKIRISTDELYEKLKSYDVISFDIFDTVIYRKVEYPNDVFTIMASEMGHNDFLDVRKKAEESAREEKFRNEGTREVVLSEIYDVLKKKYGIDSKWQEREIELEIDLSVVNPYMYDVYTRLVKENKVVIFTSDMYLPKNVIEKMLRKNGYLYYKALYLSNELGLRKGDGTLQQKVKEDFPEKRIIHVGDAYTSDIERSISVGIDAHHNKNQNFKFREYHMDGLGASFYRAVINNTLNNGTWNKSLYFEHGFRVGGILALGFCEYIQELVNQKKIDKILFCARDCDIIWQIYKEYFNDVPSEYIQISRYAIMNADAERYLYDLINRFIIKYANQFRSSKTIEAVLTETGYGYLVNYLEDDDIDKFLFPASIAPKKIEAFLHNHRDVIINKNQPAFAAAKKYFDEAIGEAENVLVVDIGWSGTCITALKHFVEEYLPEKKCNISGVLMCTSRGRALTTSISDGTLDAYVYTPFKNADLTRFMMPSGVRSNVAKDLLHMPLEYLFTSVERSLVSYQQDDYGNVVFERTGNAPVNAEEILEMQAGIKYFIEVFTDYCGKYKKLYRISPYVAFMPLQDAIKHPFYSYEVYKNFLYDACTAPYADGSTIQKFGELFNISQYSTEAIVIETDQKKKILFVTPELTYTGTPRSLLRMCKVAVALGYQPIVWSAKPGPFIREYEANDLTVEIVTEKDLEKKTVIDKIKSFDMAVCNTIVTDKYAKKCSLYIPVVWYIREATNIPDFCRNNEERLFTLRHSRDICCVSDYAAEAIGKFTKNKIRIVHNSVEDEKDMALPYVPGSGDKVKFVQFGTMEFRKGYDVLLAAYRAMPEEYRNNSELYFAGGFINSGTPYCSYLFSLIEQEDNVHYLGVVKGEQNKIETLSKMDVVVVASRDESCSLVALEGAMLSKPIIVTENVGAKYMVENGNGYITKTGDVETLKKAMMDAIDNKAELAEMGKTSRVNYEKMASMDSYTEDMKKLYAMTEKKDTLSFKMELFRNRFINSSISRKFDVISSHIKEKMKRRSTEKVIVSFTSHPGRISSVHLTVESLLKQKSKPEKILLWLSKEQFPGMEKDLPKDLLDLTQNSIFEIRWADDDFAPHKKYLYTVKEYPDHPFIIVDDDVIYDENLVGKLMDSYRRYPDCISCMRANLMMFRSDGNPRIYDKWVLDYKVLQDIPSYQLLPTGVGGVLYPPHSLPEETFDQEAIKETCLYCDDLWLKIMAVSNGYRTVVPRERCEYEQIPGTQETALWRKNVHRNNNDVSLELILEYFDKNIGDKMELLGKMRKDRFC